MYTQISQSIDSQRFSKNDFHFLVNTSDILLSITIASAFTLFGEDEPKAGYYFLGFSILVFFIFGIGVWRLISVGRSK